MTGKRFAVHILAHENPQLFGDLVASLRHPQIDVYAHIDAKSPQAPFAAAANGAVRFVPEPVRVYWGGRSQVTATLASLAQAGHGYHRHSLLSGADVLLRPLDEVVSCWSDDAERIRIDARLDAPDRPHRYRMNRLHFPEQPALHRISGRIPRPVPRGVPLCQGSQWWSLTGAAVRHLRTRLRREPGWFAAFRGTLGADEIVFHSLLADSPYASAIVPPAPDVHGQHFIDWSQPPYRHPAPLTEADLPRALASGALFARKVGADWTWRDTGAAVDTERR